MRGFEWLWVLAVIGAAPNARAQDEAAIEEAYQRAADGLKEFRAGHFSQALDDYSRAYAIVHLPALAVHIARANVKLGHWVAALHFYDEAMKLGDGVGDPRVQSRARAEAQTESSALRPRVPKIVFRARGLRPGSVKWQVDGAETPLDAEGMGWLVDPGSHQVTARFGTQQQARWTAVSEGDVRELQFVFVPPAFVPIRNAGSKLGSASSVTRSVAWVSLGIGGAGLLVWGTTGVVALKKSDDLKSKHCGGAQPPCPPDRRESYERWKTAATVGFYTGAAAVLTGATLFLVEPKQKKSRDSSAHVIPWLGIGSAGVEGQF